MPDRSRLPEISPITSIRQPKADFVSLDNGIRLGVVKDEALDLIRLDLAFSGGKYCESRMLAAKMTCGLLDKGTATRNAQQVADDLDFYGSWLTPSSANHFSFYSVTSLSKYVSQTYAVAEDVVKNPSFAQNEMEIFRNKLLAGYRINSRKVSFMGAAAMNKAMYGANHPYGRVESESDITVLTRDDVVDFHKRFFNSSRCHMIVCGNVNDEIISQINKHFGGNDWAGSFSDEKPWMEPERTAERNIFVEVPDAVQNNISISSPIMTSYEPDYHKLKVLVTLLGGYFGSRLMMSIREDKGYTYGITAALQTGLKTCFIKISTDADCKYTDAIVDEVFRQMEILKTELVKEDELRVLKNYILGNVFAQFDSSYSISDYCLETMNGRPEGRLQQYIDAITTITPQEIISLANKYFNREDFITVVAGRKI